MCGSIRGPMCSTRCGPGFIDDGTLCLTKTYPWKPIRGKPDKKAPEVAPRSNSLESLLQEAAELLQEIGFGNPAKTRRFDRQFWKGPYTWTVGTLTDYVLLLADGKTPSDAVNAIFKSPDKWTLDCAMFAQAILLYCLLQRLGSQKFHQRVHSGRSQTRGVVMFRQHRSTGLTVKKEQEFTPITRTTRNAAKEQTANRALASAPVGSLIVFTNMDAPEDSGFRNENAIKLEPNLFIAHAIHHKSAFATREAIEQKLMQVAVRNNAQLANMKQIVSVTGVVEYQLT